VLSPYTGRPLGWTEPSRNWPKTHHGGSHHSFAFSLSLCTSLFLYFFFAPDITRKHLSDMSDVSLPSKFLLAMQGHPYVNGASLHIQAQLPHFPPFSISMMFAYVGPMEEFCPLLSVLPRSQVIVSIFSFSLFISFFFIFIFFWGGRGRYRRRMHSI
jgi:hypothetical protein